jgi:hypothetical protein
MVLRHHTPLSTAFDRKFSYHPGEKIDGEPLARIPDTPPNPNATV